MRGKKPVRYLFQSVCDRSVSNKIQTYNIGLISAEALTNEARKISKTMEGRPDIIVKKANRGQPRIKKIIQA